MLPAGLSAKREFVIMKKILLILLTFTLILSLFCFNISAEEKNEFSRAVDYCVRHNIITEEEKDLYFGEDDTDLGSVVFLLSRMSEVDFELPDGMEATAENIRPMAVDWAVSNGILELSEEGYDPSLTVSREEFACIINNYAVFCELEIKSDEDSLADYKDSDQISEDALVPMQFAVTNGLLEETEIIAPKDSLSGGELAQALMNFDKKVDVEPVDNKTTDKTENKKEEKEESKIFMTVSKSLAEGFLVTLELFALTLLFALPLGLVFSFASMSRLKPIKWIMKTFIWIIRGTPLMLQLIVIYYGPGLVGAWAQGQLGETSNFFIEWLASWHTLDRFLAALIAFVVNYACYFSEIFRGGIESISRGQYEAGQVLGMTKLQVFFRVVLLQVVKRIIAPMSNEIITLVKDTSLARTIAVYEVIWAGQSFIKSDGLLWPLFYTAVFYLIFCGLLTLLFGWLEKKLSYFRG